MRINPVAALASLVIAGAAFAQQPSKPAAQPMKTAAAADTTHPKKVASHKRASHKKAAADSAKHAKKS